jgi:hypothetical protein
MQRLQDRASGGMCALWYVDVTGCCLTPYIPYAWPPRGKVMAMPTSTHRHRLNVFGLLHRRNDLDPSLIAGKVDISAIVACCEQLSQQVKKSTYVLLDTSPLHRSQACMRHRPHWVKRGLIIKYSKMTPCWSNVSN